MRRERSGKEAEESNIDWDDVVFEIDLLETDLDTIQDKASIMDSFQEYAQRIKQKEATALIQEENLNEEEAKRYIIRSLKREFASDNGTELNAILPKMSPLNPQYLVKKQSVFKKLTSFIEKFKGIGVQL